MLIEANDNRVVRAEIARGGHPSMTITPNRPEDGPTALQLLATAIGAAIGTIIWFTSRF